MTTNDHDIIEAAKAVVSTRSYDRVTCVTLFKADGTPAFRQAYFERGRGDATVGFYAGDRFPA